MGLDHAYHDNKVTVISMNCQGLADPRKRRDVFHYLRDKSYSICLLQDTHFDPKLENCIRAEWGYKCYFASYNSSSRGVAILFNNNFEFSVNKVYKDIAGNYIFATVRIMDNEFVIVSLYGPNRDNPEFYASLRNGSAKLALKILLLEETGIQSWISHYYNYKHFNNAKAQEQVENLMINLDLLDIWREIHPEMRRYTWRRNTPLQQSRLDFFLISDLLSTYVTEADIKSGYRTDHSMITLTLTLGKLETRNKLLWKFNNSLLKDKLFSNEINDVIRTVTEEYAEQLPFIPKCDIQFVISDQLFLDVLLMKIRSKTISYATMKKRADQEKERDLQNNIQSLETKIKLTEDEKGKLESYKQELIALREKKMEGVLLRSRARWVAEREKITKYFCALEKRNYVSKQMITHNINRYGDIGSPCLHPF